MSGMFVPSVQTGNLVFVSGHIAKRDGQPWVGRLGDTMTTAEGQQAARAVAEDLLQTLGDLTRIRRIVKVMVLVHSAADFTEQHLVANGASELLIEKVSEHARSAFGVAQLPYGVCVEIELIAELR
jgi:enamine deaminase RidA (YjgF/YER057c/UK114 family)